MNRPLRLTAAAIGLTGLCGLAACGNTSEAPAAGDKAESYVDPSSPAHSDVSATAPTLGEPADPNRKPPAVSQAQTQAPSGQAVTPNNRNDGDDPAKSGEDSSAN